MQNVETAIDDLNSLVLDGKPLEAFEKYYHENVIMQENHNEPTVGKSANRKREEEFFGNIIEFRGARNLHVTTGENSSVVVWHYDYTHREWGIRNYTQASVQTWKDGKIIREQFFYGN